MRRWLVSLHCCPCFRPFVRWWRMFRGRLRAGYVRLLADDGCCDTITCGWKPFPSLCHSILCFLSPRTWKPWWCTRSWELELGMAHIDAGIAPPDCALGKRLKCGDARYARWCGASGNRKRTSYKANEPCRFFDILMDTFQCSFRFSCRGVITEMLHLRLTPWLEKGWPRGRWWTSFDAPLLSMRLFLLLSRGLYSARRNVNLSKCRSEEVLAPLSPVAIAPFTILKFQISLTKKERKSIEPIKDIWSSGKAFHKKR